MENVGQSHTRNKEYEQRFGREQLLQNLVKASEPIIFDIGAHRGESVSFLKRIFPSASIYSFEPDPDSYKELSSLNVDRVTYFNLAISDSDGTASFFRNKISHTNSLLKVNLNSKDSIGIAKATEENDIQYFDGFNEEVKVNTVRLDSFISSNPIDHIDLLKIDVQGAECQILNGAIQTLYKTRVIILEISFFDYYENQTTFMDIEQIISPLGFKLFSISEISNNPMNGRTDWSEVVYLNQNMINK